jgi:hypothetical protein
MPLDDRPIGQHASVGTWAEGLRRQWGGDPLAEDPEKLATLAAFCDSVGMSPDEVVAFCFLRRKETGERFGSVKRREELAARIEAFKSQPGLTRTQARKRESDVLSFLIHNGVLIQQRVR